MNSTTKTTMMTFNAQTIEMEQPQRLSTEDVNSIIETQLKNWDMARNNFFRLKDAERRNLQLGDLSVAVQYNPARIVSTGAKVDSKSIQERKCFLCSQNRPKEQSSIQWLEGWELLINPFPILPVHFTIVSTRHQPQASIPLEMASMAEAAPDLAIFYNGAHAGASAPDHLHLQAVLHQELPLISIAEKMHPHDRSGFMSSEEFRLDLPFQFVSAVISPDMDGMRALAQIPHSFGVDSTTHMPDKGLVNAFFWIGSNGMLRAIIVPRRRHRPSCYAATDAEQFIISPGAIDMTGLMIVPRKEDFDRIDAAKVREIYSEVAFADKLPLEIKQFFRI